MIQIVVWNYADLVNYWLYIFPPITITSLMLGSYLDFPNQTWSPLVVLVLRSLRELLVNAKVGFLYCILGSLLLFHVGR